MSQDFFGYHLILDCKRSPISLIKDPNWIKAFSRNLVKRIDMKAYGEPIIENFAHENPRTGGITLVQLIETSSITCHFIEASGDMYLDVFSCKEYDIQDVIKCVNEYFCPEVIKITYLTR